jgi:hypothetical protein
MKILFFITHSTLNFDHAKKCIDALSSSVNPITFDMMWIYNTHPLELDNTDLINYSQKTLGEIVTNIKLFPSLAYPKEKKLSWDIACISKFCNDIYCQTDRVLLLKSDILVSKYLLSELHKTTMLSSFILTPPFIVSKKRATYNDICKYLERRWFIPSDDITFFNENEDGTFDNDHRNRPGLSPKSQQVLFISCTVKSDFSCHYMTIDCMNKISLNLNNTWGGINFSRLKDKWIGTTEGFVVHQYHSIESENRLAPREGTIEEYMLS